MKTKTTLTALLAFLLLTASECEIEQDFTKLPPETQEGKNTFGCLINGEIFVKGSAPWMHSQINACYFNTQEMLSVGAWLHPSGYMRLDVQKPIIGEQNNAYLCSYCSENYNDNFLCFGGKNIGIITLTRFDTVGLVVSGSFSFDGQYCDSNLAPIGDSIINVTEGRFDVKFKTYE